MGACARLRKKFCADYVTASNEEDGVAQSVEKLILAEVHAAENTSLTC